LRFIRPFGGSRQGSFGSQGRRYQLGGYAIEFQYLPPARASGNDTHGAFRNTETLGNEIDQGAIGGIFHRGRRDANLDHAVVHSGKFGLGGARLNMDL
jgi:hypothetical protein